MRAVLDANVLISALLSPRGTPARLLTAWQQGRFELIVSAALLRELERSFAYPKLRRRIAGEAAADFIAWIAAEATIVADSPPHPALRSRDPDDDYLLALSAAESAMLVSGDAHLLELADEVPVQAPVDFLRHLGESG